MAEWFRVPLSVIRRSRFHEGLHPATTLDWSSVVLVCLLPVGFLSLFCLFVMFVSSVSV